MQMSRAARGVCVWVAEREAVSKQSWLKAVLHVASGVLILLKRPEHKSTETTITITQSTYSHKSHLTILYSLWYNKSHVCQKHYYSVNN